jgi:hypothetical protein
MAYIAECRQHMHAQKEDGNVGYQTVAGINRKNLGPKHEPCKIPHSKSNLSECVPSTEIRWALFIHVHR